MDKNKFKNPSSIRIPDDLKQWFLRQAFIEKRTFGNLVNKVLSDYREEKDPFPEVNLYEGSPLKQTR